MSDFYSGIRTVAIDLLTQFRKPVAITLTRSISGDAPDASKPWRVGTPTELTFNLQAVVLPEKQALSAPTLVQDLKLLVPGNASAIKSNEDPSVSLDAFLETDRIDVDGVAYSVMGNSELRPGTETTMFTLRLKAWRPTTIPPSTQFTAS